MRTIIRSKTPSFILTLSTILVSFLLVPQTTTHATTIIHTPFARMCQEADAVIEGTVASKSSRILPASGKLPDVIVTDVVLTNVVALKGSRPNSLTITHLGGTVGAISATVPGIPNFEVGERKILFLDSDNALFGFWEGTFTIIESVPGVTAIERADGYLVTGEFDESTGELKLHVPGQRISKAVLFMEESSFRNLIGELSRNSGGGKGKVLE